MKTKFVSLRQALELFDISRSFLYQLKRKGKLKFYYIESKPFIKVEDFEALMVPDSQMILVRREIVD